MSAWNNAPDIIHGGGFEELMAFLAEHPDAVIDSVRPVSVDPVTGEERDASFPWMDDFEDDEYDDRLDEAIDCLNAGEFEEAVNYLMEAAEDDNSNAQFNLGLCYAKGCGVKRDFTKAADWMRRAAENGDEDAEPLEEQFSRAEAWRNRAEAGDAAAQSELADLYIGLSRCLDQYGPEEEPTPGQRNPPIRGICRGCTAWGGRGVDVNRKKVADTYEKAARLGYAPAQWNLAVCYLNGTGRLQNEVEGFTWAYQSADQDYELAVDSLRARDYSIDRLMWDIHDSPGYGEHGVTVACTEEAGRVDRCEHLHVGDEVQVRIVGPKGGEKLEVFFRSGSIGLIDKGFTNALIALLMLDRVSLRATALECTPKSQRGKQARSAHVALKLTLQEKQPETPEERTSRIQREKAEEEKRRAVEVRKRAEEEKHRAEEEARKKAEEERKKAEEEKRKAEQEARRKALEEEARRDEAKWTQDCIAWEAECQRIRDERIKEQNRIRDERRADLLQKAEPERDRTINRLNSELEKAQAEKAGAEATLAGLGLFKLSEKKAQKEIITRISTFTLPEPEKQIRAAAEQYQKTDSEIGLDLNRQRDSIEREASRRIPMPESLRSLPPFFDGSRNGPQRNSAERRKSGEKRNAWPRKHEDGRWKKRTGNRSEGSRRFTER